MNIRTCVTLIVVGVAVVISFFLKSDGTERPVTDQSNLPEGYYLKGVELTGTDALGKIQYTLRAQRVEHDPSDGSIKLVKLALEYGNSQSPWVIKAERGQMPKTSNEISLSGNVEVEHGGQDDNDRTTIRSNSLHIDIDRQSASTPDPVRIMLGGGSLQGVGLDVDFANERLDILSEVRGVFDPPPQNSDE